MSTHALAVLALLGALAAPASAAPPGPNQPIRRLALVAGANEGGAGRVKLRYAATDAQAVARVLEQLGGMSAQDVMLLDEPGRAALMNGFDRLGTLARAAQAGSARVEVLVYYSGHSDENGLLLGADRVTYPELRAAIDKVPADVRIAILDSCSSGALIRSKGGKRLPPFLIDSSSAVRGHAFLTATSADEAAQESDRIGGSFFTYALLTGLRGAADATRDGRVTLTEAYQFAFAETLARTEKLHSGPQHPAYDIQLAGTGDLVMTDLRGTSAGLVLADELDGRVYLRDASGRLVAELRKLPGAPIELGLDPGMYEVTLESNRTLARGRIQLADGRRTRLERAQLASVVGEIATRRGNEPEPAAPNTAYRTIPVNFALWPTISVNSVSDEPVINYFALNVVGGSARLHGFEMGIAANTESEAMHGLQLSSGANLVGGEVSGGQVAAGLNVATGAVSGVQIAGGMNLADAMRFAQVAGGLNIANGEAAGVQIAGGANIARKPLAGFQIAGGANLAREPVTGFQIAGGANVGTEVGGQVAVVNYAAESGMQIGVVNLATKSSGLQLGVVNIGEDTAVPIGVINIIRNGYFRLAVWGSDVSAGNVGVKMGGRHFYTILAAGAHPRSGPVRWTAAGGFGGHIPLGDFFIDVDALASNTYFGSEMQHASLLSTLRVVGGWQLLPHLAITAGPTFNVLTAWEGADLDLALGPQTVYRGDETTVRLFPGFVVGLQI